MIKEIVLRNFQAHKKTNIEFCSGVNVITGSSDQGKSAVIRAINWVFTNRPSGTAFKNREAGDAPCSTTIILEDDQRILRLRSDNKNAYKVGGKVYKALGTKVPDEVLEALNLEYFNIQSQFEPVFLLNDSPGDVSKKLNKLVGLDAIDSVQRTVTRLVTETNSEVKRNKEVIAETVASLEKYKKLKQLEEDIKKLKEVEEDAKLNKEILLDIQKLIGRVKTIEGELIPDLASIDTNVKKLEKAKDNLLIIQKQYKELKHKVNQVQTRQENVEETKQIITASKTLDKLKEKELQSKKLNEERHSLTTCARGVSSHTQTIEKIKKRVVEAKKELDKLIEELGVCPLCGAEL